ncbi:NOP5/NOP56 family protein [Natrialbaceae archaeon AArc-T1-2]|uniref:NOP5/NOP56 family protein n=1 Tax=Natrialbaceae archaeon AArc-T1-2 TaxID=3053904 RepID=UPI00255A88FF|nr:NOP5/NOP56 family protein [Natrialbaceae archaeon AArc-T1-2]WIV66213.1 NOP5/NOP56 family protein [Natrialbaceae archaeon AArc-T1-2]
MTDSDGWFAELSRGDETAATAAVREGSAEEPREWPRLAVEAGFADDADDYYDAVHEATTAATREAVRERERADDRQLVHAVRAMDDCRRTANELAERLAEWAGTVDDEAEPGLEYARELAAREPEPDETRLVSLASRVASLADEADELREFVERKTPSIAPNLAALAGSPLAARLISLAGGLEELAKQPSGTIQVLGAEDALFAHLRGHAPSPKHGIIYTHEAVRGTRPEDRGSAARALAGKLAIAARIDHYSGDYRPELEAELAERIETIQARADDEDDDE